MLKRKSKRISSVVLTLVLAVAMVVSAMTVSFADPQNTTRMDNNKQWLTATAEKNADAKFTLEKTFTSNKGSFPDAETFRFNFERVAGWWNDNTSTTMNGTTITDLSNIPMPKTTDVLDPTGTYVGDDSSGTATTTQANTTDSTYHKIESGKAANGSNGTAGAISSNSDSVVVTLGKYNDGTYTNDGATNNTTQRTRATAFGIEYTKAGYYVYKVKEVNDAFTGVNYDPDEYYIVVDVANRVATEASSGVAVGDTIDGVFVQSITKWENLPSLDELNNKSNNNTNTAIGTGKDIGTDDNTDDATKKGISTSKNPDETKLNFDNDFQSNDIILKKNVKGTLGDRTKEFVFDIDLGGLAKGTYTIETSGNATLVSSSNSNAVLNSEATPNPTLTVSQNGTSTKLIVKLKDDAQIHIKDLNIGATYTVTETKSDHTPSYTVTSDNAAAAYAAVTGEAAKEAPTETYYTTNDGTDTEVADVNALEDRDTVYVKNSAAAVIAKPSSNVTGDLDADRSKDTQLATGDETVDATDGTVTILYTNTRDITTETGIPVAVFPIVLVGLIALIVLAASRRKRSVASVEEFDF